MRRTTRRWVWGVFGAVLFLGVWIALVTAQEVRVPEGTGSGGFPVEGEVTGDSVSIRVMDSADSTCVAFAFKGDKLRVLGESGEWYKVALPRDYTMWVSSEFITVGANKEGVVTGDNVRARAGAGVQYQALGHLDRGRRIEIVAEKAGWLQFRFVEGDRAYISRRYVTLAGETAPRQGEAAREGVQPTPPREAEAEPETDQKIMETFNRAEEIYAREVRKEQIVEWDLDEAHALYVSVLEKTRNKNLIQKCRSRCAVIALARRYRQVSQTTADPRKRLEEREKEIEKEFERKRKTIENEIRELFPTAVAVGRLTKLASPWLQPASHKLISDDRVTYILYSKVVDLTPYEGKLVGIEGEVDKSIKWPIPALNVTAVLLPPAKDEEPEKKPESEEPAKEKKEESEKPG